MDYREAREILEKYWQGASSLEEERRLKDFFSTPAESLPDDLQEVAGLFNFYKAEASRTAGEISSPWAGNHDMKYPPQRRKVIKLAKRYWEYAAIFLLVLCSVWLLRPVSKTVSIAAVNKDTFEDPEKAMEAAQKALQIVAANLNKGKAQMQKLALFNEAEQAVKQDKDER